MSNQIRISPEAEVFLQYTSPGAAVIILPPGFNSVDELLCARESRLHATLTHDQGIAWPDAIGCQLANAAAEDGGFIALQFMTESDAQACLQRLRRENQL